MLTVFEYAGAAFFICFCISFIFSFGTSFVKRKKNLENAKTQVGLSPITWEEMAKSIEVEGGSKTADYYRNIVMTQKACHGKRMKLKQQIKKVLGAFIVAFFVSFGFNMFLMNLDRLYELESICKPGITSATSEVRNGKTSDSIEGLLKSDSLQKRIETCKDWGFNP